MEVHETLQVNEIAHGLWDISWQQSPVGKNTEKAVCRSVFLARILSAELIKTHSFMLIFFWRFCPLGGVWYSRSRASCVCKI